MDDVKNLVSSMIKDRPVDVTEKPLKVDDQKPKPSDNKSLDSKIVFISL